jgi:peptidoglycan/xylan/chitin deacetylase (PgdA/CDA1 family)
MLVLALLASMLAEAGPPPGALATGMRGMIVDVRFDFLAWEVDALWSKLVHWLLQPQRYMAESARCTFVREYAALVSAVGELERRIATVYADPEVEDAAGATAGQREERGRLRAEVERHQPLVEAIVSEQVGTVLVDEGLGYLGQTFPPVGLRFSPLPHFLIVSPRERIETSYQEELVPGLDAGQQEAIEDEVDRAFDVSSLVSSISGLSAWPAMVLESSALDWTMEVAAHEWTHHYLYLHPLGWGYELGQETRTINETTASIVGGEVGWQVLARYYPDLLPPPPADEVAEEPSDDGPAFDFRAEMRRTRVEVDRLLARGAVEEAERYMEERRQFFWEHGYLIRKLNQAYFALHGAYADRPGAAGEDPVGPAVLELRRRSSSLRAFLIRIDGLTTLQELEAVLGGLPVAVP